ncbi:MAG: hypothetical protein ABIJ34_07555 [archaeon]
MDSSLAAERLASVLEDIFGKYNLSPEDVVLALAKRKSETIPLSAFSNPLSTLEIVVKYLKENQEKSYHEIAVILNRNDRTVWCTYNNSRKKLDKPLSIHPSVSVPISIFASRDKSVLESLALYLKGLGYSYQKIATALDRNYQTIYTVCRRGMLR